MRAPAFRIQIPTIGVQEAIRIGRGPGAGTQDAGCATEAREALALMQYQARMGHRALMCPVASLVPNAGQAYDACRSTHVVSSPLAPIPPRLVSRPRPTGTSHSWASNLASPGDSTGAGGWVTTGGWVMTGGWDGGRGVT